ncbi:unnamed protein product, partial [Urochloa humidicola]
TSLLSLSLSPRGIRRNRFSTPKGRRFEVKRRADGRESAAAEAAAPAPHQTTMAAPSPSPVEAAPPLEAPAADDEEDEWDNDVTQPSIPAAKDPEPLQAKDEKIYLGPHGAPPSQAKQQELNTVGRKQRFRNKLKEADKKFTGNAQENKVESLRELMGARASGTSMPRSSPRDWLDPHCHESEFDRKPTR